MTLFLHIVTTIGDAILPAVLSYRGQNEVNAKVRSTILFFVSTQPLHHELEAILGQF